MTKPSQIHILTYIVYPYSITALQSWSRRNTTVTDSDLDSPHLNVSSRIRSFQQTSWALLRQTSRNAPAAVRCWPRWRFGRQVTNSPRKTPLFARRTSLASVASASNKSLGMLCALRKATNLPKGPWPLQTSNEYPRIMRKLFFGMAEIQTLEFQWSYGHLQYVLYQWSVSTLNPVVHFLGSLKPSCNIKTKADAT